MAHCSGALGIPRKVLSMAKKQGCAAFDGSGRVRLLPLIRWIFSEEREEGSVDWGYKFEEYRAKREALKLRKEEGESLDADEVRDVVARGVATLFTELERMFVNELPPALAGLDAVNIRIRAERATAEIKTAVREKVKTIAGAKVKPAAK